MVRSGRASSLGPSAPGALVDLVDLAVTVAGLSWWAKGDPIHEDRLVAVLVRDGVCKNIKLHAPPAGAQKPFILGDQVIQPEIPRSLNPMHHISPDSVRAQA